MTGPQIAEKKLNAFDRKVLRKIYGPVLANGQQQNRYNHEICNLYKEMELTSNHWIVKASVGGNVMMMIDERVPKKAMKRDAKKMLKCKNWRSVDIDAL